MTHRFVMRHVLSAAFVALLPAALHADPPKMMIPDLGVPITAAQFDAYATGKTLSYSDGGQVWGSEHYMPNHQVMWAFTGKECEFGQWYADQDAICFVYEGNPDTICWQFFQGPSGLIARFLGSTNTVSEVSHSDEPMQCAGPQVGA